MSLGMAGCWVTSLIVRMKPTTSRTTAMQSTPESCVRSGWAKGRDTAARALTVLGTVSKRDWATKLSVI